MAEALLEVLIDRLSSVILGEIGLIVGVDKEMKKLSTTLTTIQKVLEDAEDKQFQSKAIRNWLAKLNDITYEIEDVLDECATEVSKLKHKGVDKLNYLKKILYNYKIGRRMKEVAEKLDAIAAERHTFQLREIVVPQSGKLVDWRRETGSIINEPDHIHGRDGDRDKIVDVLVKQVAHCQKLSVLPIIGVGGLGKTTLAQLVYNDARVGQHFDTKLWVCVSDHFDFKTLLEAMIVSATKSASNLVHLDALQYRLREVLSNQKYLLVLDDVWNDNQEVWAKLKSMLPCGLKGSSIVVTTRLKKVADVMGTLPSHCLDGLSEEDCWLLFKLRAFGHEEKEQHRKLETIGKQIVKKCAGVPLAAKALGGLLRFKREEKEWVHVNESEIWNLPEDETSILPVLRLSYHHLPFILKRCFAYCAVFPKDTRMEKQDLIFRWMAHGCISSNGRQEVEDVGDQIWNELVLRSFFQQVEIIGGRTYFKMHDLVHDLAQSIMENKIPGAETSSSSASASHIKIREVNFSYSSAATHSSSIVVVVSSLTPIMNYNRLRILKLNGTDVKELPKAIGKLKHLRLFDLSYSSICTLPQTFCGLWNLQILILDFCNNLKSLPKNIRYMTNLRHIFLQRCCSLSNMPPKIGELASLKTLSVFIVGDKIGNELDELGDLNLGGSLEIKHLERVTNHVSAKKANLVEKSNLRNLVLHWEGDSTSSDLVKNDMVLEALEPHTDLESLEIRGFKGTQFPPWMEKMKNLIWILIEGCPNCVHFLHQADLPRLESLFLANLGGLEYIVNNGQKDEIGVIFPSLKTLELVNLSNLKGLFKEEVVGESSTILPNLRSLIIRSCPLLKLPEKLFRGLKSVADLRLVRCKIGSCFPEGWVGHLTALEKLYIYKCLELEGLAEENFKDLHLLKLVYIRFVEDMVSLPQALQHIPSLQSLMLWKLPQLSSLPEWLGNLTSLTRMSIQFCPKLPSLPSTLQGMTNLEELVLEDLGGLEYIVNNGKKDEIGVIFPSLKTLELHNLPNLKGLFKEEVVGETSTILPNLRRMLIRSCPLLKLPEKLFRGLKSFAELELWNCKIGWVGHLTALQILHILSCSELEGLAEESFKDLHLLKQVNIFDVKDMVSLPQALQHIPSLQSLTLSELPQLSSLPEWLGNLTSLTHLSIYCCPKLPSLPSTFQGMTNLNSLSIIRCPQLERRCKKEKGEDWHKIAHIPNIDIS